MRYFAPVIVVAIALGSAGCLRGSGQFSNNDDNNGDPTPGNNGVVDGGENNGAGDGGNNGATDAGNNGVVPDAGDAGGGDGDAAIPDMPADQGPSDVGTDADMGMPVDMDTIDFQFMPGVCGNDVVEYGETCDPCGLDCDDGNACTVDEAAGDDSVCLGFCRNRPLLECVDADGCCPSVCDATNDSDCSATCGDGVLDAGETCDPVGTCPTDCDDQDPATRDLMTGSAENCNVVCTHVPILVCIDGDGYCPAGCYEANDSDCSAYCGNGLVESGETCDPPGSCPTCDDGNPCTQNVTEGDPSTCDVVCSFPEITACVDGDGCCGASCAVGTDNDCSPTCGNRVKEGNETCDGPPDCNQISCTPPDACSSAFLTGDRNDCNIQCSYPEIFGCQSNDGCCPFGCTADVDADCDATCGNLVVEPGEVCDPPETCETSCLEDGDVCTTTEYVGDPATCDAECINAPITACGAAEGCCPPTCNETNDPDCDPFCGNGVVETGEICDGNCAACDDGDACTLDVDTGSAATCDLICQYFAITQCVGGDGCCAPGCNALTDSDCAPVCGNSVVEPPETCDGNCDTNCNDNNACTVDGSTGSAANCDFQCAYSPITACVGGDGCCPAGCDALTDIDCP